VTYAGAEAWASAVLRMQGELTEFRDSEETCASCRHMAAIAADQLDLGVMHHAVDHPAVHVVVGDTMFALHPERLSGLPWHEWPGLRP